MLQINLLPKEEKEKILAKRTASLFNSFIILSSILLILVAALLGYFYWIYSQKNQALNNQLSQIQAEKNNYADSLSKINEYNQVLNYLKQLSKYKTNWLKILSDLASQTPAKLQISKFDYSPGAASSKKAAIISGISSSYHNLVLFQEKLNNSAEFKNASLNSATINDDGTIAFEISVELKNLKITPPSTQKTSDQTQQGEQ